MEEQEIYDGFEELEPDDDFSDVFKLSTDNLITEPEILPSKPQSVNEFAAQGFSIAEFDRIDVEGVIKEYSVKAKNFVSRVNKFIKDFDDESLTNEHREYLESVAQLQTNDLTDLMTLVDVNKKMILNIVNQVNAVGFEDLMLINSYNNLINQHIKLIKELQTLYKSIPSNMKKMLADVRCDQQLLPTSDNGEVITKDYGDSQFNNQKQLLQALIEKQRLKQEKTEDI